MWVEIAKRNIFSKNPCISSLFFSVLLSNGDMSLAKSVSYRLTSKSCSPSKGIKTKHDPNSRNRRGYFECTEIHTSSNLRSLVVTIFVCFGSIESKIDS